MQTLFASAAISISELKKNPSAVIGAAEGAPVAVLVHNKPTAYLVPAETFQLMMEQLEDAELAALVRSREKERSVKVTLDEL
ncbi:MAG TPA: type II toxin-antitoxin system prevent-host-death family antitoxin [Rudaea sp.]|jgi:antitoxin StbD|uniref:type II toxin-antitoxin system Phd/YefM family antitoxin n=1 Tax=Rudaea sp. TaxID=2136325 RepID=UPI002F93B5CE